MLSTPSLIMSFIAGLPGIAAGCNRDGYLTFFRAEVERGKQRRGRCGPRSSLLEGK
jgi:hypothetical protein